MTVKHQSRKPVATLSLCALFVGIYLGVSREDLHAPQSEFAAPAGPEAHRDLSLIPSSTGPASASHAPLPTAVRTRIDSASDQPATDAATFAQIIDLLCNLSDRTASLAQDDEMEAAQRLDREAQALMADAMTRFPDAGERAARIRDASRGRTRR